MHMKNKGFKTGTAQKRLVLPATYGSNIKNQQVNLLALPKHKSDQSDMGGNLSTRG